MLGCDRVGLSGILAIFTKSYSINIVHVYIGIITYCRVFFLVYYVLLTSLFFK